MHSEDFKRTLREIREEFLRAHAQKQQEKEEVQLGNDQIHVYVRKRPLLPHEVAKNEFDVISSIGKREIVIHECKMYNGKRMDAFRVSIARSMSLRKQLLFCGRYAAQVCGIPPPALLDVLR